MKRYTMKTNIDQKFLDIFKAGMNLTLTRIDNDNTQLGDGNFENSGIIRSAIQGMGNTVLPMVSGIVEFVMRTLSALMLPVLVGETGIFFAEIAAWLGADVVLVISYFVVMAKMDTEVH